MHKTAAIMEGGKTSSIEKLDTFIRCLKNRGKKDYKIAPRKVKAKPDLVQPPKTLTTSLRIELKKAKMATGALEFATERYALAAEC